MKMPCGSGNVKFICGGCQCSDLKGAFGLRARKTYWGGREGHLNQILSTNKTLVRCSFHAKETGAVVLLSYTLRTFRGIKIIGLLESFA